MSYVVIGRERYVLPIGQTLLGGSADDALPAPELRGVEPSAIVEVMPDGSGILRATYGGEVHVEGTLMTGEITLRHGLRVEIGEVALVFGDLAANGATARIRTGGVDALLAQLGRTVHGDPTASTGGRLHLPDGGTIDIPPAGVTIGRDPECDVPLADMSVSRHHATVKPTGAGYLLTDLSSNGVLVNGARVEKHAVLGMHDVVRIGGAELRFEADPAPHAPASPALARRSPLLAALEVLNPGPLLGMRYRVEQPIVHMGRGKHNEIRIADESVSSSHATLTRRGALWSLLDLGSRHGSWIGTERVTERTLDGPAELRLGNVRLLFTPVE